MECRIRILDDEVANKIAAGEVVERPASVVKELVENAIDAGATRIHVEVEDGGKALIRVTDNGCGMTAQEAVLALQRHATSKITQAEDLAAVRTLGFRGEALPSVASVSRLSLLTRPRGELEGIRLEAEAGEIRELEPAGVAEGAVITIRDLFYNTPARLKFLKTTRTELGQICDVLTRAALSHPEISIRLSADGAESLDAPGSPDPLNSITALFGADLARELIEVRYDRPGLSVTGHVSRPPFSRPTRSGHHFFVNGRAVRHRSLTHAVDEAYRASMPSGRFPFVCLHVEIDPAIVDVNVHPTKAEVRFLRDWEVHRAVLEAVRQTIGATAAGAQAPLARQQTLRPQDLAQGSWLPSAQPSDDPFAATDPGAVPAVLARHSAAPVVQPTIPDLEAPTEPLRPIAQLWDSYILAEGTEGLLIIDQHLAHERILFDRLRSLEEGAQAPSRSLSTALTLQLSHREAVAADELLPDLARLGFALDAFGRDAFLIRSVPDFVAPGGELQALRELLADLLTDRQAGGAAARPSVTDRLAASTACRAAIKKGARLGPEELRRLLEELAHTTNPHSCPHGCAISVQLTYRELLKRFKRI
ncbi:MAG: DNA mismatch repair endonuclease MutL [Actinomycetota bacterium]